MDRRTIRWVVAPNVAIAFVFLIGMPTPAAEVAQKSGSPRSARVSDPAETTDALKSVPSPVPGAQMVELNVGAAKAFVVKPLLPRPDGWKPWVWYAPSLAAADGGWTLPSERHFGVIRPLLEKGFYFCGVDVGESYGSPAGRAVFTEFHKLLTNRFGLAPKACLFPVSRGGLMHYNWAVEHPECVQCIGAIYPVCSLQQYPRLSKASSVYGMSEQQLLEQINQHDPLERLRPLAEARTPIFHLHGDQDAVVPLEMHSAELARRYHALGGKAEIVVVKGKGHEFAPEFWREPRLAEFFLKHADP